MDLFVSWLFVLAVKAANASVIGSNAASAVTFRMAILPDAHIVPTYVVIQVGVFHRREGQKRDFPQYAEHATLQRKSRRKVCES